MALKFAAAVSVTAGLVGAGYILWNIYWRAQRKRLPTSWRQVGTLADLLAYPIKSCQWVELKEAECTHMGLRVNWLRDRTLMVVDQKANFISARGYPELFHVKASFEGARMTLTHPNMGAVTVDLEQVRRTPTLAATVWRVQVKVYNCGREVGEWFSRLLRHEADAFRLVYYASSRCRALPVNFNPVLRYTPQDTGAFPDETSYHLINEASVEDLNARVTDNAATLTPRQFRPNFVVKGAKPLEEDGWQFVRIGDNVFEVLAPCTRCVVTTIDPETAVKNAKGEPLETLRSYRQVEEPELRRAVGTAPRMGVLLALRSAAGARVTLHDPVYVSCP